MIYGSLFTGIGGLDLAVEAVFGAKPAWQCEIDPFCRRVLERHWPGVERYEDITQARPPKGADLICGGFPCQDVSSAGKRAGITGKRSGLWREFARIVRDVGPRYVVVENVTSGLKAWLPYVLADLDGLGYDAEWETVRASDVGAPYQRARTFILARANGHVESARPEHAEASNVPATRRNPWAGGVPESVVRRVDARIPDRMDRLRALGNAVVPEQAALALRRMMARVSENRP